MNRNPKEKDARIEVRTSPGKKKRIQQIADKCNLSVSEYVVQRALGYEPITVLPDAFYRFYSKLCDVTNELKKTVTPETEAKLVDLTEYIRSTLLLPYKETPEEIQKRMEDIFSGSPKSPETFWGKEHPRNGESFDTCGESDEWSVM